VGLQDVAKPNGGWAGAAMQALKIPAAPSRKPFLSMHLQLFFSTFSPKIACQVRDARISLKTSRIELQVNYPQFAKIEL
jgi:hypothetical protein